MEIEIKHELALSTAFTLVETEGRQTDVSIERVLNWRRPALYDWLESRWGLRWDGAAWM